jgi:5-methylcytosine-specific restriction endonuclease McrBC regulatory subunit McrC
MNKIDDLDERMPTKGISRNDIYQMLSYAMAKRSEGDPMPTVILLYPVLTDTKPI